MVSPLSLKVYAKRCYISLVDLQINGCTTGQKKTWLQYLGHEGWGTYFSSFFIFFYIHPKTNNPFTFATLSYLEIDFKVDTN